MKILFAFFLFALPLIFFPNTLNDFDVAKNLVFRSFVLLILFIGGVWIVYNERIQIWKERYKHPIVIVLGLITLVFAASTYVSAFSVESFWGNYQRFFGLVSWLMLFGLFIFLIHYLQAKHLRSFIIALVSGGAVTALYGLIQKIGWNFLFTGYDDALFEGRIYSTIGNPDFLAQYLAPLIILGAGLFTFKKVGKKIASNWQNWLLNGLQIFILIAATLLTQSRAVFVGLAVAIGLEILWRIVGQKISWKKIAVGGAIVLVCFGGLGILASQAALPLSRFNVSETSFKSLKSRLVIWNAALQIIYDHPALGTGIDTFSYYFPQYVQPDFYVYEESLNTSADREHNELLQFGVWGGIPAMILYIALIVILLIKFFTLKNLESPKVLPSFFERSIFLALFVIIFQNQFTFSGITHYVFMFFLFAAVVVTTSSVESKTLVIRNKLFQLLFIPLALFIALGWYHSVYVVAKESQINDGIGEIFNPDLSPEMREQKIHEELEKNPYSAIVRQTAFNELASSDEMEQAINSLDNKTIGNLVVKANYYSQTQPEITVEYYKKALQLNPKYVTVLRALGDLYYSQKKCEEAIRWYDEFLKYAPPFWSWKDEKNAGKLSAEKAKTYRIFFKNEPDFSQTFEHLRSCYVALGNAEKAAYYQNFVKP